MDPPQVIGTPSGLLCVWCQVWKVELVLSLDSIDLFQDGKFLKYKYMIILGIQKILSSTNLLLFSIR